MQYSISDESGVTSKEPILTCVIGHPHLPCVSLKSVENLIVQLLFSVSELLRFRLNVI